MHEVSWHAERPLDTAFLKEQGKVERTPSSDGSKQASDHAALSLEMAVEWAHLGGD